MSEEKIESLIEDVRYRLALYQEDKDFQKLSKKVFHDLDRMSFEISDLGHMHSITINEGVVSSISHADEPFKVHIKLTSGKLIRMLENIKDRNVTALMMDANSINMPIKYKIRAVGVVRQIMMNSSLRKKIRSFVE